MDFFLKKKLKNKINILEGNQNFLSLSLGCALANNASEENGERQ
jgi:hypothetical protein